MCRFHRAIKSCMFIDAFGYLCMCACMIACMHACICMHVFRHVCNRVDETNLKSSDPNSEPQGITNYDIEVPCKILDHSNQFNCWGGSYHTFVTIGVPLWPIKSPNMPKLSRFAFGHAQTSCKGAILAWNLPENVYIMSGFLVGVAVDHTTHSGL